jgi:hypothetical protein
MNKKHAQKLAERAEKRAQENAENFLNSSCLLLFGVSLQSIGDMSVGNIPTPGNWNWEKFYEWQGWINLEFSVKNRLIK